MNPHSCDSPSFDLQSALDLLCAICADYALAA